MIIPKFGLVGAALLCTVSWHVGLVRAADWQPVPGQLLTRWAADVDPKKPLNDYPRPQMVRPDWMNLNGLWDFAITPKEATEPESYQGNILVPFPIESALSGVKRSVQPDQRLWYQRTVRIASKARRGRTLLHFGAVDWDATVWVNGVQVGHHVGGYDSFTCDITDALKPDAEQLLVVSVWDPTDQGYQPRGKQVLNPRGIWYTAVTGIWRTVWLEHVPDTYIQQLTIDPVVDKQQVRFAIAPNRTDEDASASVTITSVTHGDRLLKISPIRGDGPSNQALVIPIPQPRLWSPSEPWLYRAEVVLRSGDRVLDRVTTYFGMRKIHVGKAADGFLRLMLNNKPLFQFGPLDQGWWPDGLYRAPTDEALRYDLDVLKKMHCNMIRKHVKVEPERWYYHCDRMGIMVWQDMPSGDKYIRPNDADLARTPESADNYRREYKAMIDGLRNHPCIVAWVPFNEGWGQFDTTKIIDWTKQLDPTRLVDGPSGWADRGTGDMHDMHRYPGPAMPEPESKRAAVLGEFGGLGLPIEGHLWWNKRNWGYRTYKGLEELQQNYEQLIEKLRPLIAKGLAAAVYTQTTDVEGEVNGIMTYNRAIIKRDMDRVAALHKKLYLPPPVFRRTTIVPTSEQQPQTWRYTTTAPSADWFKSDYDDHSWKSGPAGFGQASTPGAKVHTPWRDADIWIRRTFTLSGTAAPHLHLRVHHDEDAEVFLNGHKVASLAGFISDYEELDIAKAARLLNDGANVLAVHCHQTSGGQYIDVGLVDVEELPATEQGK